MRGIRKIERAAEKELEDDAEDAEAKVVRDYCAAVRGALTDDALPPLVASGLKLQDRLSRIAASLDQVVATAGTLPGGLKRLQQVLRRGLEETAALFPAVRQRRTNGSSAPPGTSRTRRGCRRRKCDGGWCNCWCGCAGQRPRRPNPRCGRV